ncbi:hypothetical protein HD554DRAFT_2141816 [Boletus coccyginus]|nr:hypothetical protein HD554DRAFT_2141816 [Boletus coccyginus]
MAIDWLPSYHDLTDHHEEDIHQQLLDLVGHLKTFTDTLMAELPGDTTSIAKIAKWSNQEVDALVQYFHEHRAEMGDGNFKEATFSASAEFLRPLHTMGKIKDAKSVRNKWGQLKAIYAAISHYCNQSGFHWDNENGANIQGTAASQVFDTYVAKKGNGLMKNFHNRGWKYLEQVEDILPHGGTLGERSYRGTIGVLPIVLGPDQAATVNTGGTDSTSSASPLASHGPVAGTIPLSPATLADTPTSMPGSSKHPFSQFSTDTSDPSLLFSPMQSLPSYSIPSPAPSLGPAPGPSHIPSHSTQGASKRSRTAAMKDDRHSNVVAINMVNNSIRALSDTITTKF